MTMIMKFVTKNEFLGLNKTEMHKVWILYNWNIQNTTYPFIYYYIEVSQSKIDLKSALMTQNQPSSTL